MRRIASLVGASSVNGPGPRSVSVSPARWTSWVNSANSLMPPMASITLVFGIAVCVATSSRPSAVRPSGCNMMGVVVAAPCCARAARKGSGNAAAARAKVRRFMA